MPRDQVLRLVEDSAEGWREHPKLHRKAYLYDADAGIAGGVDTWDTIEDAQEARGDTFLARIAATFGGVPTFQCVGTPIIVDTTISSALNPSGYGWACEN